ncbi:zf-DHHC-domain-containing protein [Periconia macrospinosa]|uniref:Palmitoyltransferase n=1 Tax=Periconia macrospinosa TaxID=97972 RepID=A0A2V1DEX8_9PLEO|nr:zf-DHHC-domain-containing protein [Periconia macrospinosa]
MSSVISEKSVVRPYQNMDRILGRASAILMPLLELGAIGFSTYVFVYSLCIRYLLAPTPTFQEHGVSPRRSTGIALITLFFIILVIFLLTWMRLIHIIWTNPGIVPLGDASIEKDSASARYFDKYAAYTCDYQGRPKWCDKCHNYKPDRAHHCRELNRCVQRMDHYCPWAGGIISETSHKFFIQFVFYGMLWTGYMLIPMAYFLAERIRLVRDKPATWIALVALSAIFCLFTGGMFFMTTWNVSINYTTVEVVQRGGIENIAMLTTRGHTLERRSSRTSRRRDGGDGPNILCEFAREDGREYVVFQTQPFENPWDLGNGKNMRDVMGASVLDWFLPLKMSPCLRHDDPRGEFRWSPVIYRMAREWEADNPGRRVQLLSHGKRRGSRSERTGSHIERRASHSAQ